jgi:hypothetical protein
VSARPGGARATRPTPSGAPLALVATPGAALLAQWRPRHHETRGSGGRFAASDFVLSFPAPWHWESPALSGDVKLEFIHLVRAPANRDRIVDQSAPIESVMDVVKVIGNSRAASRAARLRCVFLAF